MSARISISIETAAESYAQLAMAAREAQNNIEQTDGNDRAFWQGVLTSIEAARDELKAQLATLHGTGA